MMVYPTEQDPSSAQAHPVDEAPDVHVTPELYGTSALSSMEVKPVFDSSAFDPHHDSQGKPEIGQGTKFRALTHNTAAPARSLCSAQACSTTLLSDGDIEMAGGKLIVGSYYEKDSGNSKEEKGVLPANDSRKQKLLKLT